MISINVLFGLQNEFLELKRKIVISILLSDFGLVS